MSLKGDYEIICFIVDFWMRSIAMTSWWSPPPKSGIKKPGSLNIGESTYHPCLGDNTVAWRTPHPPPIVRCKSSTSGVTGTCHHYMKSLITLKWALWRREATVGALYTLWIHPSPIYLFHLATMQLHNKLVGITLLDNFFILKVFCRLVGIETGWFSFRSTQAVGQHARHHGE